MDGWRVHLPHEFETQHGVCLVLSLVSGCLCSTLYYAVAEVSGCRLTHSVLVWFLRTLCVHLRSLLFCWIAAGDRVKASTDSVLVWFLRTLCVHLRSLLFCWIAAGARLKASTESDPELCAKVTYVFHMVPREKCE